MLRRGAAAQFVSDSPIWCDTPMMHIVRARQKSMTFKV
jgi:hypothetical protein